MPSPIAITGSFVAMEAAGNSTVAGDGFRGDLRENDGSPKARFSMPALSVASRCQCGADATRDYALRV
jgi:hypothetical protein